MWIGDSDGFWYERTTKTDDEKSAFFGKESHLVDAKAATNTLAFDHHISATALSEAAGQKVYAANLPISKVQITLNPLDVTFTAFDALWACDRQSKICTKIEAMSETGCYRLMGKKAVFTLDNNIWLHDLDSGEE